MDLVASHPILNCAEAGDWEKRLLTDEPHEWTAMQQAGSTMALSILDDFNEIGGWPVDGRVLVLAGKGHNGGDVLLAAKVILERHPQTVADVLVCFGEGAMRPLARRALAELRHAAGSRVDILEKFPDPVPDLDPGRIINRARQTGWDLCLDGIFGFQFHPPMDDATARLLASVNTHPRIRFRAAVDLPSGVGESTAAVVFRADFTYATGILKTPVVRAENAAAVGRLRYVNLGFFSSTVRQDSVAPPPSGERVLTEEILAPLAALRAAQSDKRSFGHLFVVGGSRSYPGAVVLAVRAALRGGTGLVTAFVPEGLAPEYAARHPEAMWIGCPVNATGGLAQGGIDLLRARVARASALLIGPGLGADPDTITLVGRIVEESPVPLVLDADALRAEIVAKALAKTFVCTPHAGEHQRIAPAFGEPGVPTTAHGVMVLKGPLTRVTDGRVTCYSPFGGPVLARGGSGDILAGLLGGLVAQQPEDPLLASCRAVVWHGRAADLLARAHGQTAVETSQLLEQLGPALKPTPWQIH